MSALGASTLCSSLSSMSAVDAPVKLVTRKAVLRADRPSFKVHKDRDARTSTGGGIEASALTARALAITSTVNKENVDPKSGLPVRKPSSSCKKRKGDALAPKAVISKESALTKKRKLAVTSQTHAAEKTMGHKSRPGNSMRCRGPPSLPVVDEESDADVLARQHIKDTPLSLSPEVIDARCYELTVLPLADISEAHECSSSDEESARSPSGSRVASVAPSPASSPPPSPLIKGSQDLPRFGSDEFKLSTPERKSLYSSFTFTSSFGKDDRQVRELSDFGFADSHASFAA